MKTIVGFIIVAALSGSIFETKTVNDPSVSDPFTIAIDPAHGGKDEGMSFNGALEKDITLAIAKEIINRNLQNTSILLLRSKDSHIPIQRRIRDARSCDLYISIHTSFNEFLKPGPSVFYSSKGAQSVSSQGYGDFFAQHLTDKKEVAFESETEAFVLDNLKCPGIAIEVGNIGTITDFYDLTSSQGQKQLAEKIANVIQELARKKRQHAFSVRARSHKPRIDSIFQKSMEKAKGGG